MDEKILQFGKFIVGRGDCWGYLTGTTSRLGESYYKGTTLGGRKEDDHIYSKEFVPCHEPLPLEPTLKEWARFIMEQMPNIEYIFTSTTGEAYIKIDGTYSSCGREFPDEDDEGYTRAELFPEPKPDYESMIGTFGKFWDEEEDVYFGYLVGYKPENESPFIKQNEPNGAKTGWKSFSQWMPSKYIGKE